MSKLSNVIREVLYEEKNKTLKLFYNIDIFIQEFIPANKENKEKKTRPGITQPEQVTTTQSPQGATPPPVPSTTPITASIKKYFGNLLNEDIFKSKAQGTLIVSKEKAENIQTLEDLLDFLSDADNNKKLISDLVIEIILGITGVGQNSIQEIINEGDKLLINLDYGNDMTDSIGLKVNKNAGSNTMTMSMKKDGKILSGKFDTPTFNKQLIFYRNSFLD